MPGRRKCEPGCTCKKHSKLTDEERAQRHRDQSREGMARWRERNPGPGFGEIPRPRTPEEQEAWEERGRQLKREYARHRRATDPQYAERQRELNRLHGRRYQFKSKFGITLDDWDRMLVAQTGRCYLCERPLGGERTSIHVDHDHACCPGKKSCGKCIRGLACQKCNQGIGQFDDDPQLMLMVAVNLEAANRRLRGEENA